MRTILTKLGTGLLLALLVGCTKPVATPNTLKVGTIAGPETQLIEAAQQVAAQQFNLKIDIVQFNDYSMPNIALADGSIDANVFQHQLFLDATIKAKGYNLTAIAKTFVYPMGIYSQKYSKLADLPLKAKVAIPNDPSNEARALLLLQQAKLLKLKPNAAVTGTSSDIIENPKQLKIIELDAAQMPRALADVDLAVINTNYAMIANLFPSQDALFIEDQNSPYANLVVVRSTDQQNPKLNQLVTALHSKEVQAVAEKLFHGQAIPAWRN